jgi:hypothetical protein
MRPTEDPFVLVVGMIVGVLALVLSTWATWRVSQVKAKPGERLPQKDLRFMSGDGLPTPLVIPDDDDNHRGDSAEAAANDRPEEP